MTLKCNHVKLIVFILHVVVDYLVAHITYMGIIHWHAALPNVVTIFHSIKTWSFTNYLLHMDLVTLWMTIGGTCRLSIEVVSSHLRTTVWWCPIHLSWGLVQISLTFRKSVLEKSLGSGAGCVWVELTCWSFEGVCGRHRDNSVTYSGFFLLITIEWIGSSE